MHGLGDAELLVLPGDVGGLDTDRLLLPGGGTADVFTDDDGDTLVQVGADRITVSQLVAGMLRSPRLAVHGRRLELAVVGARGHDRLVLAPGGGAVFVHTRRWTDATGPHVAVVRGAPDPAPDGGVGDDTIAAVVRLLDRVLVAPSAVSVVHVEPRRQPGGDTPPVDGGLRMSTMVEADLAVPAWGVLTGTAAAAEDEVVGELREARDAGTRVLVVADDGIVRTVGRPAGPGPDLSASGSTRLVDAPAEWLWGAPLH